MTKGTTAETVDGMSLAKIDRLIEELRYERFRWTPVRRVNISQAKWSIRADPHLEPVLCSGIPTWTDKMLQEVIWDHRRGRTNLEVIRMILAFFWLERHSGDHLELNTWYQRYL